ncbi:MAG: polysaccharide deacetylase family protein [Betaproteobacteria bacterium]|jgi:peptidoglycan/xylan/chitin deacetylase (PgdA/CDA1 family)|nr:polysaccharide deacetylase [Betaproteobacteria bacterium]
MRKHIVCLTFDFDAISGFIARGQTTASWRSRGEFGPRVGAPRLLALFRQYGIRTSWYVPGHTIETFPAAVSAVVEAGHEIGHHGWTHRPPASLTREQEEAELVCGNEAIRRISGRNARGYRSPSWDLSPHSVELMLKHGFDYDSSMMGDDYTPYYARQGDRIELEEKAVFGTQSTLVEMPIHWSTDDSPHFEFVRTETSLRQGLQNAGDVLDNWIGDFLYMKRAVDWGVLTYTCHPFIIGRGHRMLMLERLIRRILDEGGVFQRVDETVDEYRFRAAP